MREVMRAFFGKGSLLVLGQLTAFPNLECVHEQLREFMRHLMPDVQLIWSEGVAHMLDESRRPGSILKPLCE